MQTFRDRDGGLGVNYGRGNICHRNATAVHSILFIVVNPVHAQKHRMWVGSSVILEDRL